MLAATVEGHRPRVVIVGAGFGGLSLAKGLAASPFEVTLIDRHNYHLFQPLLYQVATAALSPADIAAPIRAILRGQANVTVALADVSGVDVAARQVIAEDNAFPTISSCLPPVLSTPISAMTIGRHSRPG